MYGEHGPMLWLVRPAVTLNLSQHGFARITVSVHALYTRSACLLCPVINIVGELIFSFILC